MKTIAYRAVLLVFTFIVLADFSYAKVEQRQVMDGDEIKVNSAAGIMRKVSATEAKLAETEVWERLLSSSSMSVSSHTNAPLNEAAPALAATDTGLLVAPPSAIIPPLRRRLATTEAKLAETEVWERLLSSSSMSVSSHANAPLNEAAPVLAATDTGLLVATPSAIVPPLRRRLGSSVEARIAETEVWDRYLSSSSMSVSASSVSTVIKAAPELVAVMNGNLNINWPAIPPI